MKSRSQLCDFLFLHLAFESSHTLTGRFFFFCSYIKSVQPGIEKGISFIQLKPLSCICTSLGSNNVER